MAEPKLFQIAGSQFLAASNRALLADEPGVGKTAQVVLACQQLRATTVRVICPAVGIEHWKREFRRWAPLYNPKLEVLSYDEARTLAKHGMDKVHTSYVDVLVLDECHYAKNPNAARTKAVWGINGFSWRAKRIWALSGTPAPNNVSELWPMLRAYGATRRSFEEFCRHYCYVDADGRVRGSRPNRMLELRAKLKPFTLRRKKADVLPELGAIDIQPWYVEPDARFVSKEMEATAKEEERKLRRQLEGMSPDEILTFLGSSHEFATVRRYNALLKTPAVFDQVMHEIETGQLDKVVIYGYHPEPLDILGREFDKAKVGAVVIHGSTPAKKRDKLVEEWKHPNGPRVNLSSIIAAGTVLDYSAAHQVIALETDWVPGNNAQAWQRPHRHGQKHTVTVRVSCGSPIDELINDVVARKAKELAAVFD